MTCIVSAGVLLRTSITAFLLLYLFPRTRKNTRWMMAFTHEITHLVFAILFFRKIHRFNVDNKDSHVSFSSGWFGYMPITLSPYCIPLFTLACCRGGSRPVTSFSRRNRYPDWVHFCFPCLLLGQPAVELYAEDDAVCRDGHVLVLVVPRKRVLGHLFSRGTHF